MLLKTQKLGRNQSLKNSEFNFIFAKANVGGWKFFRLVKYI
jgi:hypothetical protein